MVEGGTARGQEYDHVDQLVCLGVPPAPYVKEQGEEAGRPYTRAKEESSS